MFRGSCTEDYSHLHQFHSKKGRFVEKGIVSSVNKEVKLIRENRELNNAVTCKRWRCLPIFNYYRLRHIIEAAEDILEVSESKELMISMVKRRRGDGSFVLVLFPSASKPSPLGGPDRLGMNSMVSNGSLIGEMLEGKRGRFDDRRMVLVSGRFWVQGKRIAMCLLLPSI